jgi:hypothetical protein
MFYTVKDRCTVKTAQGTREIEPGQVIKLDESKAEMFGDKVCPSYQIINAKLVNDCFLLVETEQEAEALRSAGILDVIYTVKEIKQLKGLDEARLKAYHLTKKVFPQADIEGELCKDGKLIQTNS